MFRTAFRLLLAALVLTLSACALQPPGPRAISVSEERLVQAIASQFPFDSTLLEVLDVVVSTPRITLDPAANRIHTSLDLSVAPNSILGLLVDKTYRGAIDMSYGLRFEPSDNSVRMTDVRVSRLVVDGAPEKLRRPIERLGQPLAQRLLKDFALYRLRPEDLQASEGWGYRPGSFRVVPGGLAITLDPVERR